MPRFMLWLGGIFAIMGALFLGIAAFFYDKDQKFAASASRAAGVVIDLDISRGDNGAMYAPVVEWSDANGTRHILISKTSSNPPSFERGQNVTVLYNPTTPGGAQIDSFGQRYTLILIFGGLGLVFILIGGPITFLYLRRRGTIARLKHSGVRIEAKVLRCELDRSTRVNGRSPYRVHAQGTHPRTGKLASFISEPVWVDLSETLDGKSVPVLIDPQEYEDHFIVLDEWVSPGEAA